MGIDTKGQLVTNPDPYVIKEFLAKQNNISESRLDNVKEDNTYILTRIFVKHDDSEQLRLLTYCQDKEHNETSILMGANEVGKHIVKTVVQNFGGYFLESDASDDWDWQYFSAEDENHELSEKENIFYKIMSMLPEDLEDKKKVARYIAENKDEFLQALQEDPGFDLSIEPR